MSLKAFHLFFIVVSTLMAIGFGVWNFLNYFSPAGRGQDLAWGCGSLAAAVALMIYEAYFLKKTKNVSYL